MAVKTTKETKTAKVTTAKKAGAAKTTKPAQPESVFISKDDEYLFAQGTHYDIYKNLGHMYLKKMAEKVFILRYGLQMHREYMLLEISTDGMKEVMN